MSEPVSFNAARAERANDNTLLSPAEALRDAARATESGETQANSVLILTLYTTDDEEHIYDAGWFAANLKSSEMIALMEAIKASLLRAMGFTG